MNNTKTINLLAADQAKHIAWLQKQYRLSAFDAESCFQDALVKYYQAPYNPELSSPYTYFNAILKNLAIDYLRKKKDNNTEYLENVGDYDAYVADQDNHEVYQRRKALFNNALKFALKPKERQIIAMVLDGVKYEEIAQEISTTPGNIKSIVFTAKQKIRDFLSNPSPRPLPTVPSLSESTVSSTERVIKRVRVKAFCEDYMVIIENGFSTEESTASSSSSPRKVIECKLKQFHFDGIVLIKKAS